mmetsp:Transcript_9183/g.33657  ORF Transcript_9183/g.33657 Transcript_9183/m.33657 type:complete len:260 (-) Transcript_9183:4013-4792(-)
MAGSVTCRLQTNGHTFHGANFHCSGHFAALLLGVCRLGHRGHVAVIAHGWRCILTLAQLRAIRGLCRQEVIPGAYLFCGHLSSSGHQNDPRDQLRGPSSGGPAQSCCSFGSADDTLSLREHRAEEVLDRELTEPALLRSAQASAMRLGDFVRVGERRSGCRAAHVLLPTPLRPQLARGVLDICLHRCCLPLIRAHPFNQTLSGPPVRIAVTLCLPIVSRGLQNRIEGRRRRVGLLQVRRLMWSCIRWPVLPTGRPFRGW